MTVQDSEKRVLRFTTLQQYKDDVIKIYNDSSLIPSAIIDNADGTVTLTFVVENMVDLEKLVRVSPKRYSANKAVVSRSQIV